jgi:nucleoside-diphosphate-sugar epimerase/multidrug transporter EmrE-like cation transporter
LLHERGETVRVLVWKEESLPSDVEFFNVDINDAAGVARAVQGVDYVHHNVALVPLAKAGKRFWTVNVDGTRTALEAARRAEVKMFCHMSSSAVFGSPDKMPITNGTPLAYGRAKLAAEELQAGREGMRVSCIRPRTIVGTGRLGIFEILFDWIRDSANIFIIGSGDPRFQFVNVDDLAALLLQAALDGHLGPLRQDLGALIDHAGTKSRVKSLPAIGALTVPDKLRLSPLGPWHYLTYHKPFYFDIRPTIDALGWRPRYGNVEILTRAYDWFVAHARDGYGVVPQEAGEAGRSASSEGHRLTGGPARRRNFVSGAWFAFFGAIAANSVGNLLIKVFSDKTPDASLAAYLSPWFVAGAAFFGLYLVFYSKALRGFEQNVAYPILVGATILIVMTISALFFSERLSVTAIAGAALIVAGIALLAQTA